MAEPTQTLFLEDLVPQAAEEVPPLFLEDIVPPPTVPPNSGELFLEDVMVPPDERNILEDTDSPKHKMSVGGALWDLAGGAIAGAGNIVGMVGQMAQQQGAKIESRFLNEDEERGVAGSLGGRVAQQPLMPVHFTAAQVAGEAMFRKFAPEFVKKGIVQPTADLISEAGEKWQRFWERMGQIGPGAAPEDFDERTFIQRLPRHVGNGFSSLAGAVGVTMLTKNPFAGGAFLGALEGADTFARAEDAGKPFETANALGYLSSTLSTVTEGIPLDRFIKNADKSMIRRALAGGSTEGLQELVQTVGNNLITKFGIDRGQDVFEGWLENLVVGAILGSGFGAAFTTESNTKDFDPEAIAEATRGVIEAENARVAAEGQRTQFIGENKTVLPAAKALAQGQTLVPLPPIPDTTGLPTDTSRKVRDKWIQTVADSPNTHEDVIPLIESLHNPMALTEVLKEARLRIAEVGQERAMAEVMNDEAPTPRTFAMGQVLMQQFQQAENYKMEAEVIRRLAIKSRQMGQALYTLTLWNKLSAEGVILTGEKELNSLRELYPNKKLPKGLPKSVKQAIRKKTKIINDETTTDAQRLRQSLERLDLMYSQIPTGLGQKLSLIQSMSLLMNPKTFARNIIGNTFYFAGSAGNKLLVAPAIDVGTTLIRKGAKTTGKAFHIQRLADIEANRTTVVPTFKETVTGLTQPFQDYLDGYRHGEEGKNRMLEGFKTMAALGRATSGGKYDLHSAGAMLRSTYSNRIGKAMENLLSIQLGSFDRAFWMAAYHSSWNNQMRAAKKNGIELTQPTPEMIERAVLEASRAVFQDDSVAATVARQLKKVFNVNKDFGLGDVVLKFPGIPANLVMRGVDFSPLGYARAVMEIGKSLQGREFNQREFVAAVSEATSGTVGLFGLGAYLAYMGAITGIPDEDREIEWLRQHFGVGAYRFVPSVLKEMAMTLNFTEPITPEQEELVVNYDWIQPFALPVAMGADFVLNQKNVARDMEKTGGIPHTPSVLLLSALHSFQTIEEQPLMQNMMRFLNRLGQSKDSGGVAGAIAKTAIEDTPATFIPTVSRQTVTARSNQARETRSSSSIEKSIARVKNRIPGWAETLPPKFTPAGEDAQVYQTPDTLGWRMFNSFINPAFVSRIKQDAELVEFMDTFANSTDQASEMLRIFGETGETKQAFRQVPTKIKVKHFGETVELNLNGEQISNYQRFMGEISQLMIDIRTQRADYITGSDEVKADILARTMSSVNTAARMLLFGHEVKNPSDEVKFILRIEGEFTESLLE